MEGFMTLRRGSERHSSLDDLSSSSSDDGLQSSSCEVVSRSPVVEVVFTWIGLSIPSLGASGNTLERHVSINSCMPKSVYVERERDWETVGL